MCRNPDPDAWLRGEPPTVEILDATEVARTRLLTGLRLAEGVERAVLHRAIGGDDPEAPARLVDELAHGWSLSPAASASTPPVRGCWCSTGSWPACGDGRLRPGAEHRRRPGRGPAC
ncbi:MAG: hypothetical protein R2749_22850 [Acidimicrobiales bacterium]